jgi:hypothetical protein
MRLGKSKINQGPTRLNKRQEADMRKYVLLLCALFVFILASAEIVIGDIPGWVVPLISVILIPLIVEGVKFLIAKFPNLSWLSGKVALSILAYLIAIAVTMAFTQWGQLPPLPEDTAQAVSVVLGYATALFGAATVLYNVLYSYFLNAWAKKDNILSYRE